MRLFLLSLPLLIIASQPAFASVDPILLSMAPPSSTVLAGIDVQRAASSRSGGHVLEQTIAEQDPAKLISVIGLDVRREVQQMLLVGLGPQTAPDSPHAVIAHGTFDAARLITAGRRKGLSTRQYRGLTVLVQGAGKTAVGVAFPESGVLVIGDLTTVQTVLAFNNRSDGIDPTLRGQVNRIGPANDVWFATLLSGSFLSQQLGDALPPQLESSDFLERISRSSGGLQFGPSDKLTLDLVARSPGNARLLSGLLRVGGGLAHLQTGGGAAVVLAESVLSSMQVSVEGSTVHATSAMPDAQLERALASGS